MKPIVSILLPSIITLSIGISGCIKNNDSYPVADAKVQNIKVPNPKVSVDNIEYDQKSYAQFFTYPYKSGMEIQPATGGILVMKDGCLLLQSGDKLDVPIFPHGITTWNEEAQVLTANGIEIPINTKLFTNGPLNAGNYDPTYDYGFKQQADPKCLEGRYIQFLGSQFMDAEKFSNR